MNLREQKIFFLNHIVEATKNSRTLGSDRLEQIELGMRIITQIEESDRRSPDTAKDQMIENLVKELPRSHPVRIKFEMTKEKESIARVRKQLSQGNNSFAQYYKNTPIMGCFLLNKYKYLKVVAYRTYRGKIAVRG